MNFAVVSMSKVIKPAWCNHSVENLPNLAEFYAGTCKIAGLINFQVGGPGELAMLAGGLDRQTHGQGRT